MIAVNVLRARARVVSLHQRWHTAHHSLPSKRPSSLYRKHANQYALRCFSSINGGEGDDGDDEEWLPPNHSPFVKNMKSLDEEPAHTFDSHHARLTSPESMVGEKIDVIDLEATMNNQSNQQHLKDYTESTATAIPAAEFEVKSENVEWKEVLRELKEAGEDEMLKMVVKEYNLQSHLAALDDDDVEQEENDINATETVDEVEEWDEDLEASLQGLSQEEMIDEIIENSPAFSELEMEVLSQELEKNEQDEQGGLDYDSLEELDLNDNSAYRDFRAMVLEDYNEKKQARTKWTTIEEGNTMEGNSKHAEPAATTNFSTTADLSIYPPDWKDYDSKAAFKRDFSEDDDWIPPSSESIPSPSHNADDNHGGDGQNPPNEPEMHTNDLDGAIDWLQARRSRLGDSSEELTKQTPTNMMTPGQADKFSHQNSQISIIPHTLFTTSELSNSLTAQGGTNIHIIDTELESVHSVGIGCKFIMLVTGRAASHVRVLADSIVRNLKARKLNERGVVGAMQGAEGGQDVFSNKRTRNRARRNGAANTSGKIDDDWMVVDCDNIHVHIMEATTRKCLNIESLWDLSNPNSEGSKLRRVDFTDDDNVDTYVSENPIPDEYAAKIFNDGGRGGPGGWITGGMGRVQTVSVFQGGKSFSKKWGGDGKSKGKRFGKNTRK